MAASQAKINFAAINAQIPPTTTANLSHAASLDISMVVGPSLNKITRNELNKARMRSFERPNAAASGELQQSIRPIVGRNN